MNRVRDSATATVVHSDPFRDVGYSGAEDVAAALVLCAPTRVETLIVEGRVVVENHELGTMALAPVLARHRHFAAKMVGSPRLL